MAGDSNSRAGLHVGSSSSIRTGSKSCCVSHYTSTVSSYFLVVDFQVFIRISRVYQFIRR